MAHAQPRAARPTATSTMTGSGTAALARGAAIRRCKEVAGLACGRSTVHIDSCYRDQRSSHARGLAMWLMREIVGSSLAQIGRAFGRDHTTVLSALRRIAARRGKDERYRHDLDRVRAAWGADAPPKRLELPRLDASARTKRRTKPPEERADSGMPRALVSAAELDRLYGEQRYGRSARP